MCSFFYPLYALNLLSLCVWFRQDSDLDRCRRLHPIQNKKQLGLQQLIIFKNQFDFESSVGRPTTSNLADDGVKSRGCRGRRRKDRSTRHIEERWSGGTTYGEAVVKRRKRIILCHACWIQLPHCEKVEKECVVPGYLIVWEMEKKRISTQV